MRADDGQRYQCVRCSFRGVISVQIVLRKHVLYAVQTALQGAEILEMNKS
jgi:hypothetical protein